MASGTSYNGWPASDSKSAINIQPFGDAHGLPFPGGVKGGDVATVMAYLCTQFHYRVEPIVSGWDWGYSYKQNVNNPSQLSCHASGTAVDINAPDHPNGSSGTFTDAQVGTIYAILNELQGAVDWLEGYDEMHFEIAVGASTLASIAASLPTGGTPAPEPPGPDVLSLTEVGMYIVFGPNGAKLCGPGYVKNLDGEEYDNLVKVPGMQVLSVDARGFDVHGAAMTNGESANDIRS